MNKYGQKFLLSAVTNTFFWLTALFFSSMEILFRNLAEFTFSAHHVCWIMLIFAAGIALLVSAVEALLSKKAVLWIAVITILGGICFYIQMIFLDGQMLEMMGENIPFSRDINIKNLIVWIGIAICYLFLCSVLKRRAGEDKLSEVLMIVSAGLLIIQTTGLVSTRMSITKEELNKDSYLSAEGEFDLSPTKNVLYFILDTCDREYVDAALEEDPDLFREFTGFTNYRNCTSKYSRTYPALPFLLTGEKCFFDLPKEVYIHQAHEKGKFLP